MKGKFQEKHSQEDRLETDILEVLNRQKDAKSHGSFTEIPMPSSPVERKNFEAYFKLNSWCDARDQTNVWRLAKIKKASGSSFPLSLYLRLHY